MNFEIGQTIGDYEIAGVLGSGGMGRVYKVRNTISHRLEAMKVLLPGSVGAGDATDRFLREIRVQASLNHPNIATLRTALRIDNQIAMIMELVDGTSLQSFLDRGPLSIKAAVDYMSQALSALSYAHAQGVIHRDIKPGNIMLTHDGNVKLTDFGIAKAVADHSLTHVGETQGSIFYMSPEQVEGSASLDGRADLYALGVTLYEAVTGSRPFQGATDYAVYSAQLSAEPVPPEKINPEIPRDLSVVILKSLAKKPADRFQTADEFKAALQEISLSSQKSGYVPSVVAQADHTVAEGIFLNYRREDSRADCGRLYDRLIECFPGKVFRDVGSLQPGVDWQEAIDRVLSQSVACIVLIGKNWLNISDAAGRRRLDVADDPVRREIAAVLKRGAPILPVLVGDANMPDDESLPAEVRPLCRREALELTEQDWDEGFRKLVQALEGWVGQPAVTSAGTTGVGMTYPFRPVLTPAPPPVAPAKHRRGAYVVAASCILAAVIAVAAYKLPHRTPLDLNVDSNKAEIVPTPLPSSDGNGTRETSDSEASVPSIPPTAPAVTLPPDPPVVSRAPVVPRKRNPVQAEVRKPAAAPTPLREPEAVPGPASSAPVASAPPQSREDIALQELRERFLLLASRWSAVHGSLDNLARQQNQSGLSLRTDMAAARQMADYLMREAETSLTAGNPVTTKRNLDLAEQQIEKLERFLGR